MAAEPMLRGWRPPKVSESILMSWACERAGSARHSAASLAARAVARRAAVMRRMASLRKCGVRSERAAGAGLRLLGRLGGVGLGLLAGALGHVLHLGRGFSGRGGGRVRSDRRHGEDLVVDDRVDLDLLDHELQAISR